MPLIPAKDCQELTMDFDSLVKLKSGMGTAAIIVMDKSADPVKAIRRIAYFYKHESCGQCTPCREGTGWLTQVAHRVAFGHGRAGDVELMASIADGIAGNTICALGDAAAWPTLAFITKFRQEFEDKVKNSHAAHTHAGSGAATAAGAS